jgi:hypothetical protein
MASGRQIRILVVAGGKMRIHTACKDCVFSAYDSNTQKGCFLDKIDKFRNLDVEIVDVYDEDKEFFVVSGRKCQFYRNSDWLAEISYDDDEFELLNKEVQIGVDIIILIDEDNNFEHVFDTIESIKESTIQPESIIFTIHNKKNNKDFKFTKQQYQIIKDTLSEIKDTIPYSFEVILVDQPLEKSINSAARRSNINYVCLHAGIELNEEYIAKINSLINDEMIPLIYVEPCRLASALGLGQYNNMFVNKKLHNLVGGFGKKTILEKVKEFDDDNLWSTYEEVIKKKIYN